MGITGIGSSYNYNYNVRTNKLSTKDGRKDEFWLSLKSRLQNLLDYEKK